MKLEELKNKIDQLLSLNKELKGVICDVTHDKRGYLQSVVEYLVALSIKHNLKLITEEGGGTDENPLDITVPELKLLAVATANELEYIKRTIQEEEE